MPGEKRVEGAKTRFICHIQGRDAPLRCAPFWCDAESQASLDVKGPGIGSDQDSIEISMQRTLGGLLLRQQEFVKAYKRREFFASTPYVDTLGQFRPL